MQMVRSLTLVGVATGLLRTLRRNADGSGCAARHRHTAGGNDLDRRYDRRRDDSRGTLRPQLARQPSPSAPVERLHPPVTAPSVDPLRDPIAGGYLPPVLWPGTELMPRMTDDLLASLDQLRRPAADQDRGTRAWFGPPGQDKAVRPWFSPPARDSWPHQPA